MKALNKRFWMNLDANWINTDLKIYKLDYFFG